MSELSTSELRRLDLTLLLVFLGLLRHRKALDVAAELGLTQSAISQSLKRLRHIFRDDLFLRRPHGMEPTATALALEARVAAAVDALRGAVGAARTFDPATETGIMRLATLDAEQSVLIPRHCQNKIVDRGRAVAQPCGMTQRSPFRYFTASPEVIRLAIMM